MSVEIVLCSSKYWSSFLGGTKAEYLGSCANTLIKYQIISDAIDEGINNFILGGGVSEGDGIYKYKKSFSQTIVLTSLFKPMFMMKMFMRHCWWITKSVFPI